jgi:hypothetical protein
MIYAELDSACAAAKKALLSGDLRQLTETEVEERMRPWLVGGRAWLLAQEGEINTAQKMVNEVLLATGDDAAQSALETLKQKLAKQQDLGDYHKWLSLFARDFLGQI